MTTPIDWRHCKQRSPLSLRYARARALSLSLSLTIRSFANYETSILTNTHNVSRQHTYSNQQQRNAISRLRLFYFFIFCAKSQLIAALGGTANGRRALAIDARW
jgi:hypothetical protein